jgi:tetratricopeptide (TPR) repeat protein
MAIHPPYAGEETDRIMAAQSSTNVELEERLQRGIAFKVEGNYEAALAEIQAVLEVDPNWAAARRQLGLVLGFTGMFDESLEELKKTKELDPSCLDARNDLGLTYAMLGMRDEAKQEFEEVLELDPGNATAQRQIVFFQ